MDRNDIVEDGIEELGVASIETRGSLSYVAEIGGFERLVPAILAD